MNAAGCSPSSVTFTYNGASVTYGTVLSSTGECWLDRNLGASQVATSSTDHLAYGDLFQWGRAADGHQLITWTNSTTGAAVNGTTATLSTTDTPGHGNFISNGGGDWRNPQNNNLWQGVSGINNPCPSGYRLPTATEWNAELTALSITNTSTAFSSILKIPSSGYRYGTIDMGGSQNYYATSTVSGGSSMYVWMHPGEVHIYADKRRSAASVRCIKD